MIVKSNAQDLDTHIGSSVTLHRPVNLLHWNVGSKEVETGGLLAFVGFQHG